MLYEETTADNSQNKKVVPRAYLPVAIADAFYSVGQSISAEITQNDWAGYRVKCLRFAGPNGRCIVVKVTNFDGLPSYPRIEVKSSVLPGYVFYPPDREVVINEALHFTPKLIDLFSKKQQD